MCGDVGLQDKLFLCKTRDCHRHQHTVWDRVMLTDTEVQDLWEYWNAQKPTYEEFTRCFILYFVNVTNKKGIQASHLAFKAWQIFQNIDEASKVPLEFSKVLTLTEKDFGKTSEQHFGSHRSEVAGAKVGHNLAGFMCCSVGVNKKSILVGQKTYHLGRWLGEGVTSIVYVVNVGNEECAVKVAKTGQSISMDVRNLEKLEDIKGIPRIVMSDSPSHLFITPVAEQFTLELLFRKDMHTRLGELVDTLQCAHGRGIVNRDIRLANILIAEDQFIIVDWGFAAPLDKPYSYAGTSHFASARVLKMLEKGQHVFPVGGSDDLVSLVRSLYVVSRLNRMRVEKVLMDLDTDEVAKIQEFWETQMKNNSLWQVAEEYAENGDYTALKAWVENWIQISM